VALVAGDSVVNMIRVTIKYFITTIHY